MSSVTQALQKKKVYFSSRTQVGKTAIMPVSFSRDLSFFNTIALYRGQIILIAKSNSVVLQGN